MIRSHVVIARWVVGAWRDDDQVMVTARWQNGKDS